MYWSNYIAKSSFEPLAEKSLMYTRGRKLGRSRIKSLDIESTFVTGRAGGSCRLLRRQFSLDRADEPVPSSSSIATTDSGTGTGAAGPTVAAAAAATAAATTSQQQQHRLTPRLFKQNSAGAAPSNDLERIEEVPSTPSGSIAAAQGYRYSASVSLSVESLTLRSNAS